MKVKEILSEVQMQKRECESAAKHIVAMLYNQWVGEYAPTLSSVHISQLAENLVRVKSQYDTLCAIEHLIIGK